MLLNLLKAIRLQQWTKNLFVVAALVFSRHLFDPVYAERAAHAFGIFCLISSAVYLINDIFDREHDRLHPEKASRPIASGALPVSIAATTAIVFAAGSIAAAFFLDERFGWTTVIYMAQNLAYSIALKYVVILDVMIISAGFLLRAVGGAFAIDVPISSWFILCTILLSLFLGFVKRRQELTLLEDADSHRQILAEYDAKYLDQIISVVTAGTLVSYALYTMDPGVSERLGTEHLNFTIPFVIYGLLRYLYLVYVRDEGGNPSSTLMRDPPTLACGFLYTITLLGVLYFR